MDNLAEKVNECPLVKYCLHTIGTAKAVHIQSSGVSAIQGLLNSEVKDFQNCQLYCGCPLLISVC